MKKRFSIKWKASSQRRKQRKFKANAPLHIRQKFVHVHLSKDLRKKYAKRSIGVRKGDKVLVLRGQHKGKSGRVERVSLKYTKIFISGIELTKKDGAKSLIPVEPSKTMITELNLDDKKRISEKENGKKSP